MLPPSAPALAHLKELALDGFNFQGVDLPAAVLAAMTSLTFLRISRSNCEVVPNTLPAAVNLRVLALAFNCKLRFYEEDIPLFRKMAQLETLKLAFLENGQGLEGFSILALMELKESLPALKLVLEDKVDPFKPPTGSEKSSDVWSTVGWQTSSQRR